MKPDYGIDAPNVVRSLFVLSLIFAVLSLGSLSIENVTWFWSVSIYTSVMAISLFITGCWMLYGIKVAKPRIAYYMIQYLQLTGEEKVLDLGCGRGLLLCKMAHCLPQGIAYGVDLWQSQDQSGNCPEQTLQNAVKEGVEARVIIQTADVRSLAFPDNYFDTAVSCLCFHNIGQKEQRQTALLELLRVLKPGGKFAIADIHYCKEYADLLLAKGASVECTKPNYAYCPPVIVVKGVKCSE